MDSDKIDKRVRRFINITKWQKTTYINPHEYTLKEWNLRLAEDFDFFVSLIEEFGSDREFRIFSTRKIYRYFQFKDYEYWAMPTTDKPIKIIINRAKIQ